MGPRSPLPRYLNLCPVDFVSRIIVQGSAVFFAKSRTSQNNVNGLQSPASSKLVPVCHLCSPKDVLLETLVDWAREAGHTLTQEEVAPFRRRLEAITDESHPLFSLRHMISATSPPAGAPVAPPPPPPCAQRARQLFEESGLEWDEQSLPPLAVSPGALAQSLAFLLPLFA